MATAAEDAQSGLDALSRGEAAVARDFLLRALEGGQSGAPLLLGIAQACRQLADSKGAAAALDRLLRIEPRNLAALIRRGDLYVDSGDSRAAVSFYQAALRVAPPANQLAGAMVNELDRIRATCERYAREYSEAISSHLARKGFDPTRSSRRFGESVDIVLGKRQIFVQQPKYYYFPGLPQIQFYDRKHFPWFAELEAATDAIREELLGVMKDPDAFKPYVEGNPNRPRKEEAGMIDNPDWSAFYLWKNGEPVPANAARCPKTLEALRAAPLALTPNRSPSILFSLLRPGTRIPPHHGLVNTRLICHLPLIVPGRCAFRVGNEVREWKVGEAWAFDDTIEHEAVNDSTETRVILLFDIWRPELDEEEQRLVNALFESIDSHSGQKPAWEI
jgi:aspartyl/asparaginyl beta-hydroxylase (cupin superfamily)